MTGTKVPLAHEPDTLSACPADMSGSVPLTSTVTDEVGVSSRSLQPPAQHLHACPHCGGAWPCGVMICDLLPAGFGGVAT